MSNENEQDAMLGIEQEANHEYQPEEVTVESVARTQGWRPKEEFEGEPAKWVSAEIFVERGRWMDTVHKQNKELKTTKNQVDGLTKVVTSLKELLDKAQETAMQKAREELRLQKAEAMSNSDHLKVVDIDEQILDLKAREEEFKRQAAAPIVEEEPEPASDSTKPVNPSPEFVNHYNAWLTENTWYSSNPEMRADADMYARRFAESNPGADFKAAFKYINNKISKEYPEVFRKAPAGAVGARTTGTTPPGAQRGDKNLVNRLTKEERQIAEELQHYGGLSVEDYAKHLYGSK